MVVLNSIYKLNFKDVTHLVQEIPLYPWPLWNVPIKAFTTELQGMFKAHFFVFDILILSFFLLTGIVFTDTETQV